MENIQYFISEEDTIIQTLERLDSVEAKALFVVKDNKLCATVTDGDVRRGILRKIPLTAPVKEIANYNPCYVKEGEEKLGFHLLQERKIQALPIVNDNFEIIDICKQNRSGNKREICKTPLEIPIVIMAGGMGTRLYPYTKILPKALIPIDDVPITERIIQLFQDIGCQKFFMIVNHKKNMIKAYFNDADKKYDIQFIDEDKPLGTGGGIRLIKDKVNSTFILTNCDILMLDDVRKMIKHHKDHKNEVTMICSIQNFEIPYGVVNFNEGGEISSFVEKPQIPFFTNTGYYIVEPVIFNYIKENENIGMPDILTRMQADGRRIGLYPISENSWLDMGQMDAMERMEEKISKFLQ